MCRRLLLFVSVLSFSAQALAINPCSLAGPDSVPGNPSVAEAVGFRVHWSRAFTQYGEQVFARTTIAGPQSVQVDLAFADSAAPIPGFVHLGSVSGTAYPSAIDDAVAPAVGTLPVGTYFIEVAAFRYDGAAGLAFFCSGGGRTFTVATQSKAVTLGTVVEFYNASLDHYFLTQNPVEIADLDTGRHPGWSRTGQSFNAYTPQNSDNRGSKTCRWYGSPANLANLDTHFFSASVLECAKLQTAYGGAWKEETDNAFEIALPELISGACATDTVPVYRLWNGRADSNHRYTTSLQVRQQMLERGFVPEGYGDLGVAMCAPIR